MTLQRPNRQELQEQHSASKIRDRLKREHRADYLSDLVYGGIDGTVTTFAVVSGVAGAGLSSDIVIILGFANLIGDGFSMAASNYLGTRVDQQLHQNVRETEKHHIDTYPEGEREEIRQIFAAKGFEGDDLERAVEIITQDRNRWINTMLTDEYGLSLVQRSPIKAAVTTMVAFNIIGFVPLLAFVISAVAPSLVPAPYLISTLLTCAAFFLVGAIKSKFVAERWYYAGTETLLVGGSAAGLAYIVGAWLANITS
ncbi:VIT1/CCC1 transporter family protein [Stieleria sp. JC731]|uniref:VIT1/CCC1 transporter family protein n=1 Tax=Pirellulaceae TaxID=2691357 RepID=UPI001E5A9252|nr:VIT1/CCC1 transporter family protein [Stieleria sp. JC731]MCC9600936.1 VIT1/CCC1 transporter family protein [Stieleria sp. JC731]